jgi:arylsulfatase A-like enzyme
MRFVRPLSVVLGLGLAVLGCWLLWVYRTVEPEEIDTVDLVDLNAAFDSLAESPLHTRTNVVLAIVCTFRKDRLEPYGIALPTSPFLDHLGAESIQLENHVTQAPWTRPSMGSLLTSRWPRALQLDNPGPKGSLELVLREEHTTIAEHLAEAGYTTIGSTGNPNMKTQFGLSQGLEHNWEPDSTYDETTIRVDGHDQVNFLVDQLDDAPPEKPAFLQLVLTDTHQPRQVEPRYLRLFDKGHDRPGRRARYDASVRKVDGVLARLFTEVMTRRPDTLFIVASDHGEGLRYPRHHGAGHGNHLYSTHIFSPSIWHHPALTPKSIEGLTMNLDVAPTILGLLGIESDTLFDGTNISETMNGTKEWPGHDFVFSETFYAKSKKSTVLNENFQFIRRIRNKKQPRILETLHHRDDVFAEVDILEDSPTEGQVMREALDTWEKEMAQLWDQAGDPAKTELSEALIEQLEAIGYIE